MSLVRLAVIACLLAFACAPAAGAAVDVKRVPKAEHAVTLAAVHKYGVGTKTTATCVTLKGYSGWRCVFAARPRSKRFVYAGRASVSSKLRVDFTRTICVGAGCKQ